ncbi:MAG: hypothetical protein J7M29_10660, partial [Verrucomicrobia bacterium]|nr:hypothetical protein [Verrucomicrobiota bacterium]
MTANSAALALAATAAAAAWGAAVALFAAGLPRRLRRLVYLAAAVCFMLPPFWTADCWMALAGRRGPWTQLLPWSLYSFGGAAWTLGLMLWPIPAAALWAGWRVVEAEHFEVEPGLAGFRALGRFLLPAAAPALGAGLALTFVAALNQFAVPSLLQTPVLTAELWRRFSSSYDYQAALLGGLPLAAAALAFALACRRAPISWPRRSGREWDR